jgi:uncharacterized protein
MEAEPVNYIKRDLETVVTRLAQEYPVLILTGPRQAGKTTMLSHLMTGTNRTYVTLDDLTARNLAASDPEMFFQIYKPPVLIDEVQYAPTLLSAIKLIADRDRAPGSFWLAGSQAFRLMALAGESLAGRAAILSMASLSQGEIYGNGESEPFSLEPGRLDRRKNTRAPADMLAVYTRIYRGSMPAIVSGKYTEPDIFYSSYLQTYIERDVRELSGSINALRFADFIRVVAGLCGQMVNRAGIANDLGLRSETVRDWLGILEKSGLIFYLRPYADNQLKRTVSAPKLYFHDTGLVCYLTRWSSPETLMSGALSGAILENYTVSEIVKSYSNAAREPFVSYYRDKDAKEIDLILEADGMVYPLEVKRTASPGTELARAFKLLDKGSVPRGAGAILCLKDELSAIDRQNYIVPIWMI